MVFNVWISELVKLHWENLSVLIMGCLDKYLHIVVASEFDNFGFAKTILHQKRQLVDSA